MEAGKYLGSCQKSVIGALIGILGSGVAMAATPFSLTSLSYTENFDSIVGSQTATIPTGWAFDDSTIDFATATTATTQWAGTTGTGALTSTSGGGAYLFYDGVRGTATDKALGYLSSGSYSSPRNLLFGFTNSTGSTITSLSLGWDYEKFRDGTRAFEMNFYYSSDGVTWTPLASGDQDYASGAGNTVVNPATQITKSGIDITSISITNGASYYLRWEYLGVGGATNAQALGLDDFSLTATAGGGGGNVSIGGGNTFTPSSFGGASFTAADTAVFDGTSQSISLNGAVVAAGLSFTVDGYTLAGTAGNTISTPSISVASGATATVSGQITGSNPLSKLGGGVLVVTGSNDFAGNVTISDGVLSASSDSNFGASTNDLILGSTGTLRATNSMSLASGRDLSGTGALDILAGQTLTVNGTTTAGLNLVGSGTLALNGPSTLSALTFSQAGSLSSVSGTVALGGAITTTHTSGTARIIGAVDLGTALRTVTVTNGSGDVDLDISANLSGTTAARLHKLGEGTLRLSGDNSGLLGGIRLGTSGSTTGGRLIVTNATSLGIAQFQFNHGTLEAENAVVFANGVSIGGRTGADPVLAGQDITFSGSSSLFETSGQTVTLKVNNTTTLGGSFSTGTSASGFVVSGSGNLRINGSASGVQIGTLVTDSATLSVNSQWGSAPTATITVDPNATLKGTGSIAGAVAIAGTHAVGNSVGTQTVENGVSYLNGSTFEWELAANDETGPGTNFDQLIVTAGNIDITSGADIELVFNVSSTVDWSDTFWTADHEWTVVDMVGAGSLTGDMFDIVSNYLDAQGDLLTDIRPLAGFSVVGEGNDVVLKYTAAIPEPTTTVLLMGGLGMVGWMKRRRKRSA